jgi:toxin ParE1/3/4
MACAHRTSQAEIDVLDIWKRIAADRIDAADRFFDALEKTCALLTKNFELGERRDNLSPGLRMFTLAKYVIFYRADDDGIVVLGVFSGHRDIESLFA